MKNKDKKNKIKYFSELEENSCFIKTNTIERMSKNLTTTIIDLSYFQPCYIHPYVRFLSIYIFFLHF